MGGRVWFLGLLVFAPAITVYADGAFDDVFAWGAATSAFQVEGAWNVDQKGESIWDRFAHDGHVHGDNGENACDSFYEDKYKLDIENLKRLKVSHYKMSVAWTRIFNDGTMASVNNISIAHYKKQVQALRANGITPIVALYNMDFPQQLQEQGGWMDEATIGHFANCAEVMFAELGQDVKHWITIVEPWSVAYRGYGDGSYAPGQKDPSVAVYTVAHNLIRAHTRVYRLYETMFKQSQKGLVGIVLNSDWMEAASSSPADSEAASRAIHFMLGWFAEPLFGPIGDYPTSLKQAVHDRSTSEGLSESRLPSFDAAQKIANTGACDFLGVAFEKSMSVSAKASNLTAGYDGDQANTRTERQRAPGEGVRQLLAYIKSRYNPEIYMFDNGYGDCGHMYDEQRIQYMKQTIAAVREAITSDGVRLSGYFPKLMDSFEWPTGFSVRYGLYHVDFGNKERVERASASYYRTLIQNKGKAFSYPAHFVNAVIREKDDFLRASFPPGFLWGVATAAYQIEGGWNADGKGPSIWDTFAHDNRLAEGATGDMACDSYHQYKRDVQMVKQLGVSHYRFSISWSRVLPDGTAGSLNQAGVDYYNSLINELHAAGIQPMVTLYHWDLPQALQDIGGWENDSIIEYFNDYARVCFEQFGDRVPMWLTFNEAFVVSWLGYGIGVFAPGVYSPGTGAYRVAHNIVRSHVKAWHTYDDGYRHRFNGKVGITLDCDWKEPMTTSAMDRYAAERALNFKLGWFANPIFGNGDYPAVMKQYVAMKSRRENRQTSRLPIFTEEEKKMNKGASDFFGLNHYTTQYVRHNPDNRQGHYEGDQDLYTKEDDCWPRARSEWLYVNPWGLRGLLRWIKNKYNNPPVYITENGVSDNGSLDDRNRADFYRSYTNEVLKAIVRDQCNVRGYVAWSLMDNLEWTSGYTQKFGLYQVNFTDSARTRTPKRSVQFFTHLVQANGYS